MIAEDTPLWAGYTRLCFGVFNDLLRPLPGFLLDPFRPFLSLGHQFVGPVFGGIQKQIRRSLGCFKYAAQFQGSLRNGANYGHLKITGIQQCFCLFKLLLQLVRTLSLGHQQLQKLKPIQFSKFFLCHPEPSFPLSSAIILSTHYSIYP